LSELSKAFLCQIDQISALSPREEYKNKYAIEKTIGEFKSILEKAGLAAAEINETTGLDKLKIEKPEGLVRKLN